MSWVYIVECKDGSYYTGWTTELDRRFKEHNNGTGAKYTRSRHPVQLVYAKWFASNVEAQRSERSIKSLSRADKELVIAGHVIAGVDVAPGLDVTVLTIAGRPPVRVKATDVEVTIGGVQLKGKTLAEVFGPIKGVMADFVIVDDILPEAGPKSWGGAMLALAKKTGRTTP